MVLSTLVGGCGPWVDFTLLSAGLCGMLGSAWYAGHVHGWNQPDALVRGTASYCSLSVGLLLLGAPLWFAQDQASATPRVNLWQFLGAVILAAVCLGGVVLWSRHWARKTRPSLPRGYTRPDRRH